MLLPVFKPYIRRADMDSVLSCLISDQIGPGVLADQLNEEFAEFFSIGKGALLRDYYRAISIALDVLELRSGSRVILSPLSPGAYIDVFREKGIIPLFADVESDTALMNRQLVEELLEKGADAILLFCPMGTYEDMDYYSDLGIPLIEDISENLGASFAGRRCGSFGNVILFSMEPDKLLTCGGGAALFGRDDFISRKLNDISLNYGNEIFLSDINASLALIQLRNIEENLQKRNKLAEIFKSALNKTEHKTLRIIDGGEPVHFSFPVLLNSGMNEAKTYIMKKNIEPRKAFFRTALEMSDNDADICPVASGLILRSLLFPLYPSLGKKNAEMISRVISTLP